MMASVKLSVALDNHSRHPIKPYFTANSFRFLDPFGISWFPGCFNVYGGCIVRPFSNLQPVKVSGLQTEFSDEIESGSVDNVVSEISGSVSPKNLGPKRSKFGVWRRKRVGKDSNLTSDSFEGNGKVEESELSVERFNVVLKQLERDGEDDKALGYFDWMRENGWLKRNLNAYNLIFRVLSRRGDWNKAEKMIEEITNDSGCELNYQVYNTIIYACLKQDLPDIGEKWFHLMLENGVRPNVATFGMLMSLYQKHRRVEEAEFTFSKMRDLGIVCQSAYSSMITIYTRMGFYNKAEEVIGFLRDDEVILNLENWLVVLNSYSQQGKLDQAEKALSSMADAGFPPNIIAYNTLITGYGKVSKMDDAQRLFHELERLGLEPDETTYRTMIEGWGRVDNYEETKWYYTKLKSLGVMPNSSNLFTMINLQAKHGDEEGVLDTIDDMMKIGCQKFSVLGKIVKAYEKTGRLEKVPYILKGSLYDHVLKNQTSCSILVLAYVKNGLIVDALKVLNEKEWKDSVFEDNLYHLLICTCKELDNLENAVKIFAFMPKFDEKPNLHIACTMIDIYSTMSRFSEAESLYLKMKESGICLDLVAFSVVIRMYMKSNSLEKACLVLEAMEEQKDLVPDVYMIRDMFRIYQRLGRIDKLKDLYYKTLKTGIIWDQEMYNCAINCCARALPVDELSNLFDEMLKHGFAPNIVTINVMLHVYGKTGLFTRARKVFQTAKNRGLIDTISYNTLIASYGKNNDLKNMSAMVKKMQFNGFSVTLEAYNSMLDAYGKNGEMEKFRNVLQRMKDSRCALDGYTYNIMINIYGEKRWIEEVSAVLTALEESEIGGLDLCGYNTLIKAYGIAGMVEEAVNLVKEMREKGIEPDRVTYINMINALRKNDMFLEAVKWSLWMKQLGIP